MNKTRKSLAIIPARGGSKGVKNKNIRLLGGLPLISHTINAAIKASLLDDFLVSTDSEEIKQVAENAGANVPFLRPKEYATDDAPTVNVVSHVLEWYESANNRKVDLIVLLQPTTPLRTYQDIDNAIEILQSNKNIDSLISCYDATHVHPSIMYTKNGDKMFPFIDGSRLQRRQDFEPVYVRNGAIYICRRDYFIENNSLISHACVGYIMSREASLNIDEELDFKLAEATMKSKDFQV